MTNAEDRAMEWWGTRGLEWWDTGGGCAAFGKNLDDGKHWVLVTDAEDATPPSEGRPVRIGLYNETDLVDGHTETAETFDEALDKLNRMINARS